MEPDEVAFYVRSLAESDPHAAARGARVVSEVLTERPALGAPHIKALIGLLRSESPRVVQTCAEALPRIAALAPAKVARHLALLEAAFTQGNEVARDGLMCTLIALCDASIAYHARVIHLVDPALRAAEPRTLVRWAALALPVLKGEPYAQARASVETRLPELPRPLALKLAEQLGVRLRVSQFPTALR